MVNARGSLLVANTTFNSNEAWTAGGAVSVTGQKAVIMSNTHFNNNRLWWRELAAGGGFYCLMCSSVNVSSCSFTQNRAAYGGGAAILQPWQESAIQNTSFVKNVAMPDPSSNLVAEPNSRRRAMLAMANPASFLGSMGGNAQRVGGGAQAIAILGSQGANVTGDDGFYTGGGGLYLSVSSAVRLHECVFLSNAAYNGGKNGWNALEFACRACLAT